MLRLCQVTFLRPKITLSSCGYTFAAELESTGKSQLTNVSLKIVSDIFHLFTCKIVTTAHVPGVKESTV